MKKLIVSLLLATPFSQGKALDTPPAWKGSNVWSLERLKRENPIYQAVEAQGFTVVNEAPALSKTDNTTVTVQELPSPTQLFST